MSASPTLTEWMIFLGSSSPIFFTILRNPPIFKPRPCQHLAIALASDSTTIGDIASRELSLETEERKRLYTCALALGGETTLSVRWHICSCEGERTGKQKQNDVNHKQHYIFQRLEASLDDVMYLTADV